MEQSVLFLLFVFGDFVKKYPRLTLFLCSSVIKASVISSFGLGVRLDPGVRPVSPFILIIDKNKKYLSKYNRENVESRKQFKVSFCTSL